MNVSMSDIFTTPDSCRDQHLNNSPPKQLNNLTPDSYRDQPTQQLNT